MFRPIIAGILSAALVLVPLGAGAAIAKESRPKYAKTEVDKAVGKCVGTVLGGALLGGLLGGKKRRAEGAVIGAAAGGAACAIIVRNAKRKDKIIAAQREAAMRDEEYVTSFEDDKGQAVTFSGRAGELQTYDGAQLIPVRYTTLDGGKAASPVIATGGAECREVDSSLSYGDSERSGLPNQIFCRTPEGDWEPYAVQMV